MANVFRSYGIDARIVTWKTSKSERYQLIEDFRKQKYPVLINCGILTEGTDIPNIDCILLARPTKSHNLFIQMIGRGTRLFPGKEDCHVIDMVGNISNGIITVPTLFGLDPNEISHEISLNELKRIYNDKKEKRDQSSKKSQKHNISYASSNVEYKEWNFTHDFIKEFQADLDVRRFSHFSWVRINYDKYVLSIPLYGYIKVDKGNDLYYASETLRITNSAKKSNVFYKKRLIFSNVVSLKHAISAADTYAKNKYPRSLLLKNAKWRRSAATSSQIEFLRKRRLSITQNINNISKGYAWDLITKLKHGSKNK